ncbi:Flagellar attachment zone protein 1, partial [Trypanosoma conorhini]
MAFLNALKKDTPRLQKGQTVAYDYLVDDEHWQWTLGTVVALKEYSAVVQQWRINQGDDAALRNIVSNEVEKEMKRMRVFQEQLSTSRDKLAAIRSENEDRVSAARTLYELAKEQVEVVDEVHMREVTSQTRPSPVAMEVLKAVLAVAKNDPAVKDCSSWYDIQMEYRKPDAVMNLIHVDIPGRCYPSPDAILSSLREPRFSSAAAARDSDAIRSLHQWVMSALAYQEAHSRLTSDTRIQAQNNAIGDAISGMKACRMKVMKLKEELSHGNPSAARGQVTSFTKTSVQSTIPLSAVISVVPIDALVTDCALTDDEVDIVYENATWMRFQLKDQLSRTLNEYMGAMAELHCLSMYATELEEKRLYLREHYTRNALRNQDRAVLEIQNSETSKNLKQLQDTIDELKKHDERWTFEVGPTVTTKHTKKYPGKDWNALLTNKPEELLAVFKSEQALACHVPNDCIRDVEFRLEPDALLTSFKVQHPSRRTTGEVDKRLDEFPPREMNRLYQDPDRPKSALDRAIVEVCRALDMPESKFNGLYFDEFVEHLGGVGHLVDKDAYESEIGDLLMFLDKIHNENRSLQYTLEKSAEEFRRQTASTLREQEALRQRNNELHAEIGRLRNLVEKLKDLADKQASELELFKLQQNQANQMRTQRNLSAFKSDNTAEPLYCVTLDELHEQKKHCEEAEKAAAELHAQLGELTQTHDNLLAQLNTLTQQKESVEAENGQLKEELQTAGKSANDAAQERAELRQELERKRAECEELMNNLNQLSELLESVKTSEKEALAGIEARDEEISDLQQQLEDALHNHNITARELDAKERHKEELMALAERQQREIHAHRHKRRVAHEARSLEPTLQPHGVEGTALEDEVEPDAILQEPLLSVTMDEYTNHLQRSNQLQQENDTLRQHIQQLNDDKETLYSQLREATAENQNLTEQYRSKNEECTNANNIIKVLYDKNDQQASELEKMNMENQKQTEEIEKLHNDINKLNTTTEKFCNENEKLTNENEKLADELEKLATENESLAEELEQKAAENEKLAEELEQKAAENERLAEELEQKAAENEKLAGGAGAEG